MAEILKRIKCMSGIKSLVIFTMTALYLSIMSGCKGADQFMPDTQLLQANLKQGRFIRPTIRRETLCELLSIICLYAFNGEWENFYQVFQKDLGGIGTVFLKSLHKTPAGVLINGGILIELAATCSIDKADRRDKFDIDLDTLSGMVHLLIGLWDVLRIRKMDSHNALFFKETIEAGNRSFVTTLHKLDPENDEAGMRISSAHIGNEFDFRRSMLVGMVMWPSGLIPKGFDRAVKAIFPAIDILSVGFKSGGSLRDTIFVSIINKR